MRKLFLLIPLLAFALMANAKEIEVSSGTSNIIHFTIAASTTEDGDVIILKDAGPYVSTKSAGDDYTKLSKNVTIKAKTGITPVVKLQVPIQGRDGKSAKFIGIKFDCGDLQYSNFIHFNDALDNGLEFEDCEFYNSSQYLVRVSDGKKVESLKFKNCKFYNNSSTRGILNEGTIGHLELDGCEVSGFAKEFIHGYSGSSHVDECIINDCYFHNNSRSSILFVASSVEGQQTCDELTVTNSTFANINATGEYEGVVEARPYGSANTDAIKVIVDHCTFYNNTTIDGSYSNIRTKYLTDVTISNCIFAHSEEYVRRATYCTGGGNINNCLTYNYTAEGTKGHAYGATVNAASVVADPLFTDAANGDYSFAGNWVTMALSPARGAATDGSDLGDPRWYSDEVLPSTNFANPYQLKGNKAKLSGNIWYDDVNDYLYGDGGSNRYYGTATWKLHAQKACAVNVALNLAAGSPTVHDLRVEILDADGNSVDEFVESTLPGTLSIPAEGDYTIILHDDHEWSSAQVANITLSYLGGSVQNLPCTMLPIDALRSARAYIDENGEYRFTDDDHAGHVLEEWAKWNMHVSKAGYYKFTTSVNSTNGHSYLVTVYNANETVEKGSKAQPGDDIWGTAKTFSTDLILLDEGDYIFKVQNTTNNSKGRIVNVVATYEGGAVVNIPNANIPLEDAILSANATRDNDGIHFGSPNAEQYAQWNIHATTGLYTFTLNVTGTNYGKYQLDLTGDNVNIHPDFVGKDGSGSVTISNLFIPADGDYVLQLANINSGADGYITSVVAAVDNEVLILDETATDAEYINAVNGQSKKIIINRTFKGGMYNTICVPFTDWMSSVKNIFGDDVELLELSSAELEGNVLNLNFTTPSELGHGRPYLIKPAQDVTNPMWNARTINDGTSYNIKSCTNADFIGSFIKGEVPAGENNLFLGPNNLLYFSQTATPIKGMRAWFQVKGVPNAIQAIKRANIVTPQGSTTAFELVETQSNGSIKTLENGQVIIIRDGVRYNVMGVKIQ